MFQFPRFASYAYTGSSTYGNWVVPFEIRGSMVICTYPQLIAAYHVLHRLHEPSIHHAPLITFLNLIYLYKKKMKLILSAVDLFVS